MRVVKAFFRIVGYIFFLIEVPMAEKTCNMQCGCDLGPI